MSHRCAWRICVRGLRFSIYKVGLSMRLYSMSTVSFCVVQVGWTI